jgi:hypothetical protein
MRAVLLAVTLLALAGCGDDDERPAQPATSTRLEVEVRPQGDDGPARTETITRAPAGVTVADFEPVPVETACTEIYGGPATATVTGTLRGIRIDASFSRANGCEIARWDRAEKLLGRVPGPTLPQP